MVNVLCVSHEWNLGFEELRALSNAGFRVRTVANGFEAIKQFAEHEIDAILVNRQLPDVEVSELVSFFRNHDADIPIVMLSTVMPLKSASGTVDAVIHKQSAAQLLVPTLEFLLAARAARAERAPAAENDDYTFAHAA
jgi:DNA-binding response OmpR family regulator